MTNIQEQIGYVNLYIWIECQKIRAIPVDIGIQDEKWYFCTIK